MPQTQSLSETLCILIPWWVPAVLADAAYFSPSIAIQFYPPTKSTEGLAVYNDIVIFIDMLSPYMAGLLLLSAVLLLMKKTILVRNKAHQSIAKLSAQNLPKD